MDNEFTGRDLADALFRQAQHADERYYDWRHDPHYRNFVRIVAHILIEKTHERKQLEKKRIMGGR